MEIKIFENTSTISIEKDINRWMDENPQYEIQSITSSVDMVKEHFIHNPGEIANQWM
jgi:hypothetical protein